MKQVLSKKEVKPNAEVAISMCSYKGIELQQKFALHYFGLNLECFFSFKIELADLPLDLAVVDSSDS